MNKNQVLRQRTMTGIIFGLSVILLLLASNLTVLLLLFFIASGSAFEYLGITQNKFNRYLNIAIYSLVFFLIMYLSGYSAFLWNTALILCLFFLTGIIHLKNKFIPHQQLSSITGMIYTILPPALFAGYLFHQNYPNGSLLLCIILLIWANDSFAYLVGSRIGKNKLWPSISPGKTWEGFLGGGFITLITAFLIFRITDDFSLTFWLICALIVWIIGTLGDLFESSIKRQFGVKDSGNLLPGHGGMLDRFDSFIYVLPFILFLLLNL